ncbi:CDGSH iron-sulfur domain-containing protein [Chloroflexota bacterium]
MANGMLNNREPSGIRGKIRISKNGPYLVSGGIPVTNMIIGIDAEGYSYEWRDGKEYPLKENYTLCQCGQSRSKPFCDGKHAQANFDGTETASHRAYLKQAEKISGPELGLTDAKKLFAVARFCERAGGIWDLVQKPDSPAAKRIAIEEAGNCPSGRLVVWDKQGQAIEPQFQPSIGLIEDPQEGMRGPIWVRGGIPVVSADGSTYEIRNSITLCRCGKSSNNPFCDGSPCK